MVHDDGRRALLRIEQKARCQVHADGLVRMQQREQLRLVLQIGDTRDIQTSSGKPRYFWWKRSRICGESSPAIPDSSRMRLCDKTAPIGLAAPFD